jgi:hypothetical protein
LSFLKEVFFLSPKKMPLVNYGDRIYIRCAKTQVTTVQGWYVQADTYGAAKLVESIADATIFELRDEDNQGYGPVPAFLLSDNVSKSYNRVGFYYSGVGVNGYLDIDGKVDCNGNKNRLIITGSKTMFAIRDALNTIDKQEPMRDIQAVYISDVSANPKDFLLVCPAATEKPYIISDSVSRDSERVMWYLQVHSRGNRSHSRNISMFSLIMIVVGVIIMAYLITITTYRVARGKRDQLKKAEDIAASRDRKLTVEKSKQNEKKFEEQIETINEILGIEAEDGADIRLK